MIRRGARPKMVGAREPVGQSLRVSCAWRKVRAPQGRVPGNAWGARAHGKCHRKYTARRREAPGKGEMVR